MTARRWEGVEAARKGVALNVFKLEEYDIPYGYRRARGRA